MHPAELNGDSLQNVVTLSLVMLAGAHLAWRLLQSARRFWSLGSPATTVGCAAGCHGCPSSKPSSQTIVRIERM